jgi:hypothetical protein
MKVQLAAMVTAVGLSAMAGPDLVFVLAGQSNMAGRGVPKDLSAAERTTPANVEFYLAGERTEFKALRQFGPEVGFAHRLAKEYPDRKIILFKYAVGGTSIIAWAPVWSEEAAKTVKNESAGPLYSNLMACLQKTPVPLEGRVDGILWFQGGRDAQFPDAAEKYGDNLKVFMETLRRDLKSPESLLLLGLVNPPAGFKAAGAVKKAQQDAVVTLPNTVPVLTDGLSTYPNNNPHYDSKGQLELGKRFAEAYIRFTSRPSGKPEPANRPD